MLTHRNQRCEVSVSQLYALAYVATGDGYLLLHNFRTYFDAQSSNNCFKTRNTTGLMEKLASSGFALDRS